MENDAGVVLAELKQDHKHMGLMLMLLERESNLIYEGEDPDFDLLHDIMHYMTVYPDVVHHPKEDRLYAELRAARPDLASGFERITMDHRHIEELGMTLKNDVLSINSGSVMRRKTVVANALRYVNTLRGHMQWEELDLFRRVDEMISEGHKLIDTANYSRSTDPVFGTKTEENFARLVSSIQEHTENP